MAMDINQLAQMTTWLDEEHRRDRAELLRLQQRAETQAGELSDQNRLIQELEGRLAGVRAQLAKFDQLRDAMDEFKEEIVLLVRQAEERHLQAEREAERVRLVERDNLSKTLNEIRRDLQRLPRIDEEAALRKAEQKRQNEQLVGFQQELATLSKEIEGKLRPVAFLEEARQQDAKRVARLQQESLETMKRVEAVSSRLQMMEDLGRRLERDVAEIKNLMGQLKTGQQEFVESQLMLTEQHKRRLNEWEEQLTNQFARMDQFAQRMQSFTEQFQAHARVAEGMERFQERISREQTQVAELQRLAEERQKRQFEEWQAENEKRWKKELLRWEYQWGEQAKQDRVMGEQISELGEQLKTMEAQMDALWHLQDTMVTHRTHELRRWLEETSRLIEDRPRRKT
jgi:chromosome segregation ATPase